MSAPPGDEQLPTPAQLAERAARAIAEAYRPEEWGPGPLPWAIAERFVAGAIDVALRRERLLVAAALVNEAAIARAAHEPGIAALLGTIAERVMAGRHDTEPDA